MSLNWVNLKDAWNSLVQDGWHEATETEKQLILYGQLDLKHLLDFNNYDIQVSYVQQMYVLAPFLTVMIFCFSTAKCQFLSARQVKGPVKGYKTRIFWKPIITG